MRIKKSELLEIIYNKCNLNSEDDDIITKTMYKYKDIINESKEVQDIIYNYLSFRLGYLENYNDEEMEILNKLGY